MVLNAAGGSALSVAPPPHPRSAPGRHRPLFGLAAAQPPEARSPCDRLGERLAAVGSPWPHRCHRKIYSGMHEWPDMAFMLHLLRTGDTFADIGANVGSYTVLAVAAVGASTLAFELTPKQYAWLQRNLALNHLESRVTACQAAVGAEPATVSFCLDHGPMNRVVAAGWGGRSQPVKVVALDDIPLIAHACCWKLDVEGYEDAVLAGAARTLAEPPPATILCEDRSKPVQQRLSGAGLQPCSYAPWTRTLSPSAAARGGNQLWIRDLAWARERVRTAPVFQVLGQYV